jgi:hypothetical protein
MLSASRSGVLALATWSLRGLGKPSQRPLPKGVQLILQRTQRHRVNAIHPSSAGYLVDHDTGVFEYAQMLRHRRPADRQTIRKLTHSTRPLSQHGDDLPT